MNVDLRKVGRNLAIPPGDADAVVARGATLARRRHRSVAGGMAALLAISAVSYLALSQDDNPTRVVIGDGPIADVRRGDAGIRWERASVNSGIAWTNARSEGLYAVSTAPGRADANNPDMRPFLWHSADGVEWSNVRALGDLYLGDLADRGARLYGVGTGPASAAVSGKRPVSDLVVGWSDNGGREWDRRNLPVDLRAMASKTRRVGVGQVEVVATDQAVVAVASLMAELDVPALLPDGQTAPHGWVTTADGVDVLDDGPECPPGTSSTSPDEPNRKPPPTRSDGSAPGETYAAQCFKPDGTSESVPPQQSRGIRASYNWAQLGVDDDLRRAARGEPFLFAAKAGSTEFERANVAALTGKASNALLDTNGDGMLLLVNERTDAPQKAQPKSTLLKSTDGRVWTEAPVPPGFGYAIGVGRLGARTALVGGGDGGATLWLGNPDGSWSASSLAGAVDPALAAGSRVELVAADVGPLGVVAAVSIVRDAIAEQGGVDVTHDGFTLKILNERWASIVTDSQGKEIARSEGLMDRPFSTDDAIRMDHGGAVRVIDPETGSVIATFPADKMRNVFPKVRAGDHAPTFRIVASRDGATWSDEDVQALAKDPVLTVNAVTVNGERGVVTAMLRQDDPKTNPKQVALVGTPA